MQGYAQQPTYIIENQGEGDIPDARTMGGWLYEGIRPSISQEDALLGDRQTPMSHTPPLGPEAAFQLHHRLMEEVRGPQSES
jgi:hypothetical protein